MLEATMLATLKLLPLLVLIATTNDVAAAKGITDSYNASTPATDFIIYIITDFVTEMDDITISDAPTDTGMYSKNLELRSEYATVVLAAFYFAGKSCHVLGFSQAPTASSEKLETLI